MSQIDEMTADIRYIYERYSKKGRGVEYAFARLWEDYFDENPDEEMIVYNLIIAQINLEETVITDNNRKCIDRAVKNYEVNQSRIETHFTEQDRAALARICDEIKSKML